ncbi:MRC1-like domain-containing protein [Aspergillus floccosus]
MSSPSTPRTTRSASPLGDSPAMLTPGRKIKAMLAAFDSDSDSDKGSPKPLKSSAALFANASTKHTRTEPMDTQENSSDDEEIIRPKGRMAARMQAETHSSETQNATHPEYALERVAKTLHASTDAASDKAGSSEEDDDDLPMAGPRRRIASARKTIPENGDNDKDASPRPRAFSPLFMSSPTAERPTAQNHESDASGEEARPKANARFLALVAQKRKEREEKERLEAEKKAERAKQREQLSSEILSGEEDSADEGAARRKLAKQARPPRKASKKALEEMNRETQRMSRNMQLAHQAQTKKKITKESLFARFNFMQPEQQAHVQPADSSSVAADSQQSSDAEANKGKDTPQTSPVMGPEKLPHLEQDKEVEFPSLEKMVTVAQQEPAGVTVARVEDQANESQPEPAAPMEKKVLAGPSVRVRLSRQQVAQTQKNDSDDELEIVTSPAKCRRLAVFENHSHKRTQESQAMIQLKALAHITSPSRKTGMTTAELSAKLLYQARQQAARERKERIAELRAQGMMIETAEERAAMEDELENLVEKARKEAEEIAKKERKSKKGEDDDDEEDDDYEFSGSEEEADEDEEEEEEQAEGHHGDGNVFDSEADEFEDDQSETMSTTEEVQAQRRKRPTRVISDDEDEEQEQEQEQEPKTPAKAITPSVRSVERPHIPVSPANGMTMSLTQAFAGTLGGSPHESPSTIPHSLPDPVGDVTDDRQEPDSQTIVKDSQDQRAEPTDLLSGYSQSEARVSESPGPRTLSQFSQIPDPTQDAGFVFSPFDPSKRFLGTPTSTIETVLVNRTDSRNASPVPEKRAKRLRRGREAELSVIEEQEEGDFEIEASAFDVMKKAVKKPSVPFDKQKSKAKDIVDEAAEESDDEYAGLGGASDDEDDEENVYDQQMINDNSGETVDEKQLAALNALHQRNADEKQVAKLLKDITTGALRRRKGAGDDFDLDDSDDELLARRREKQREFARMRRALLADEKIGEIAENPKKAAFFKAIEDRDMDDDGDLDFLDYEEPTESQETSSQDVNTEPQQETTTEESNKRKRPLESSTEDVNNRPPPHMRRKPASAMSKKPSTLAEIRETVSFLTERPEYDSFHEDASVDYDDQEGEEGALSSTPEREETPAPVHPRRTRGPVVDRLALLRQASSNSASSASNNRLAFHAGSGADASNIGFRPPPLVRRTTGSSTSSISSKSSDPSRRVSKPAASGVSIAKKGAVNYYTAARERERVREIRSKHRSGGSNINALLSKHASNRLGALGGKGEWD